jgi:hypothetical protein
LIYFIFKLRGYNRAIIDFLKKMSKKECGAVLQNLKVDSDAWNGMLAARDDARDVFFIKVN